MSCHVLLARQTQIANIDNAQSIDGPQLFTIRQQLFDVETSLQASRDLFSQMVILLSSVIPPLEEALRAIITDRIAWHHMALTSARAASQHLDILFYSFSFKDERRYRVDRFCESIGKVNHRWFKRPPTQHLPSFSLQTFTLGSVLTLHSIVCTKEASPHVRNGLARVQSKRRERLGVHGSSRAMMQTLRPGRRRMTLSSQTSKTERRGTDSK